MNDRKYYIYEKDLNYIDKALTQGRIHHVMQVADDYVNYPNLKTIGDCFNYVFNEYPEYLISEKIIKRLREENNKQKNPIKNDFTLLDKKTYYQKRVNDKSLTSGQRQFAEKRLKELQVKK